MNSCKILWLLLLPLQSLAQSHFAVGSVSSKTIKVKRDTVFHNGISYTFVRSDSTPEYSNLKITEGVSQPKIMSKKGSKAFNDLQVFGNSSPKVYPNPTSSELKIELPGNSDGEILYQLFDGTGKVVFAKSISQKSRVQNFVINLQEFVAGTYYLMIRKPNSNGSFETFSFKVEKVNP